MTELFEYICSPTAIWSQCQDATYTRDTTMKIYIVLSLIVLFALPSKSHFIPNIFRSHAKDIGGLFYSVHNKTSSITKTLLRSNETTLANFTYTMYMNEFTFRSMPPKNVDCFGLGETVATALEWYFRSEPNGSHALDVQFFLSSRKQPRRVQVVLGEQFGLEWTDFNMERRTIIIVHGFLSQSDAEWIKDMEKAFLQWVSNWPWYRIYKCSSYVGLPAGWRKRSSNRLECR